MSVPLPDLISHYFAQQSLEHRETLMQMRERILSIVPQATEVIKYGMPTFVVDGVPVAGIMAHKNHIGYYPYSGSVLSQFPELLTKYKTTKGALHVPLGKPLAKNTIKLLIRARQNIGK